MVGYGEWTVVRAKHSLRSWPGEARPARPARSAVAERDTLGVLRRAPRGALRRAVFHSPWAPPRG
eukprot:6218607-Alexandrium_andersonii.AAC.1